MIQSISLFCVFISVLLGWFVYVNDKKSWPNFLYFAFSLSSGFWLLCNTLSMSGPIEVTPTVQQFFTSLISISSVASLALLCCFTHAFLQRRLSPITKYYFAAQLIFLAAISFTYLNVIVEKGEIRVGVLYPVVVLFQVINFVLVLVPLFRREEGSDIEKSRKKFLRRSILASLLPIFFVGSVIPLFGYENISNLAPAFSIIFLSLYAIAILRKQLFDIRETVARSFAYLLSVGTIVTIYIGVVLVLSQFIDIASTSEWRARIIYLLIALLTALSFAPVKKFFDRVTNRVFFHDAYDPQQLLDDLSNVLVTNYELDKLGELAAGVIEKHMNTQFCVFYVVNASKQHLFGTKKTTEVMKADGILEKMESKIVLVDLNENAVHRGNEDLRKRIIDVGAELAARLTTTSGDVGVMLLGPKKGGGSLTRADVKVVDIFTDELALAFQNATRFEEISTFNATLQQKIEAATQELRRTNDKLKALDEAKDEFISMASHQLRTPLTSVKGYLSLVLDGDAGEIQEQQRSLLSQAFTSSQRMVYLISDLLNVSRLRTGKFIIEPTDVYLPDVIEEEIRQVTETAKAKNVELVYEKPKEFPTLQLDDNKIRQVIMNFMDNGIYYTPSEGKVTLELVAHSESIEFRVVDNGIGVPKNEQHKLFTKFYRAGNAQKARPDGTGLGLFMAKKVVVASGGAIIFKSQEGKGSTFGFTFPLKPEPLAPEKEEDEES